MRTKVDVAERYWVCFARWRFYRRESRFCAQAGPPAHERCGWHLLRVDR